MCEGLSCFFSLEMTGTHQGRLQKPKSQNTSAKSGEGVPLPTFLAHFFHGRGTPLTDGFRDSFFWSLLFSSNQNLCRYSIGADDDFQHHSYPSTYPSAPTDNEPYNPGYYDRQVSFHPKSLCFSLHRVRSPSPSTSTSLAKESSMALPRTNYHGGVGVYSAGPIGTWW